MFSRKIFDSLLKVSTAFAAGFTSALFMEHKVATLIFVDGQSMSPTLNPEPLSHGDLCLVWKMGYKAKKRRYCMHETTQ